jgi:hypothetical protein
MNVAVMFGRSTKRESAYRPAQITRADLLVAADSCKQFNASSTMQSILFVEIRLAPMAPSR